MLKKITIYFFILSIILITIFTCTIPVSSSGSTSENKDSKKNEILLSEDDQSRAVVTQTSPYSKDYGPFKCFWFMADHNWTTCNLTGITNDQNKVLMANMQTMNGVDPCSLRFDNSKSKITVKVEEEKSYDGEIKHNDEIIGGFLIDSSSLGWIYDIYGEKIGRAFFNNYTQTSKDQIFDITVNYDSEISDPVAFAILRSSDDTAPTHVRITEVKVKSGGNIGIKFKVEEWLHTDGIHEKERVDFVVLEKGIHLIGSETYSGRPYLLEVGTYTPNDKSTVDDKKIKLLTHYDSIPLIITQSQKLVGKQPIVTRNHSIDTADESFKIRRNEEEARVKTNNDKQHDIEDIGYMALGLGMYTYGSKSDVVTKNGNLKIKNYTLCNKNGTPVQLKGMSLFWINWEDGYKFANAITVDWLVADWKIDILRIPVGVRPIDPDMSGNLIEPYTGIVWERISNGTGPAWEDLPSFKRACEVIDRCIHMGIYVIVDWHVHDAFYDNGRGMTNKEYAKEFFKEMSIKYGKYPNVIFEIWNEPGTFGHIKDNPMYAWESYNSHGSPLNNDIKSYSEEIIKIIRDNDSDSNDNIIIVPTPCWDQRPNEVVGKVDGRNNTPINDDYLVYSFHFYAGSHPVNNGDYGLPDGNSFNPPLEYQPNSFVDNGIKNSLGKIPVFVSEWGTSLYDGGQPKTSTDAYLASSDAWYDYLADNNVSWCNWSISDKNEGAAALKQGACRYGHWSKWALSKSGEYIRGKLRE